MKLVPILLLLLVSLYTVYTQEDFCRLYYLVSEGDSCASIASELGITESDLIRFNPNIDCNNLSPAERLCVNVRSSADLSSYANNIRRDCKRAMEVQSGHTCWSIIDESGLNLRELYYLNPGLDCHNLRVGQQICLEANNVGTENRHCPQLYIVGHADTCVKILRDTGLSLQQFSDLNPGVDCQNLNEGQVLCLNIPVLKKEKHSLADRFLSLSVPCKGDSDCRVSEFCNFAQNCQDEGKCSPIPRVCDTADYNPVCGCDGLTYNTPCEAASYAQSIASMGECPADELVVRERLEHSALPTADCIEYHVIEEGDTCYDIIMDQEITQEDFFRLNPNVDCLNLQPGQHLCIKEDLGLEVSEFSPASRKPEVTDTILIVIKGEKESVPESAEHREELPTEPQPVVELPRIIEPPPVVGIPTVTEPQPVVELPRIIEPQPVVGLPTVTEPQPVVGSPEPQPAGFATGTEEINNCPDFLYVNISGNRFAITPEPYYFHDAERICERCQQSTLADIPPAIMQDIGNSTLITQDEYWIGTSDGNKGPNLVLSVGPTSVITLNSSQDDVRRVICNVGEMQ